MEKSTNTSAHKWLRKAIQEYSGIKELSIITRIPGSNFYYWLNKEIAEGEDLIEDLKYVKILQKYSKFKSLQIKLMPSSKYI